MTQETWRQIFERVAQAAEQGDEARAWSLLDPLRGSWSTDLEAARYLASAMTFRELDRVRRLALASELLSAYLDDHVITTIFGEDVETFVDMRFLNAAPPTELFFQSLLQALARQFDGAQGKDRIDVGEALASVARLAGRQADGLCERVHRELLTLRPDRWQNQYNFGLFLKTRGRFEEGVDANQRAAALGGGDHESVIWNLGICATGAGRGALAHELWTTKLSSKLGFDANGLPDGSFHAVKVRVAERPLAERSAREDSPGHEETLWVERRSPCHGRVLSAPYYDLGVEYGDLVLFDGATIATQTIDGKQVMVFPHLATLRHGGWQVFRFAGTQAHASQIVELSPRLPGRSFFYSHTEQVRWLCECCAAKGAHTEDPGHEHQAQTETLVKGKLCVEPGQDLAEVDGLLTAMLASQTEIRIFSPSFAEALGNAARAAVERRAWDALEQPT